MEAVRVSDRIPGPVQSAYTIDVILIVACVFSTFVWNPSTLLDQALQIHAESSIPTWYSSVKLFVVAVLILGTVFSKAPGRGMLRDASTYLGLVILFMSMDEIAQIHERFSAWTDQFLPGGERHLTPLPNSGLWPILVIPFLAVVVPLILRMRRDHGESRHAIRLFGTGLVILLAGAVGCEIVGNWLVFSRTAHLTEALVEESLEMIGASTMFWGALALYRSEGLPMPEREADKRDDVPSSIGPGLPFRPHIR